MMFGLHQTRQSKYSASKSNYLLEYLTFFSILGADLEVAVEKGGTRKVEKEEGQDLTLQSLPYNILGRKFSQKRKKRQKLTLSDETRPQKKLKSQDLNRKTSQKQPTLRQTLSQILSLPLQQRKHRVILTKLQKLLNSQKVKACVIHYGFKIQKREKQST